MDLRHFGTFIDTRWVYAGGDENEGMQQISFRSMTPTLEQVFKLNGVPTYTFVEPIEYPQLLSNLRTPGRGLVIEGPSGIGKTTAIEQAVRSFYPDYAPPRLSARDPAAVEYIEALPGLKDAGIVVVDDFHKLTTDLRRKLSDTKLIVVGINNAGRSLIELAPDLLPRIDIIKFDSNPKRKIIDLISKGETALNIEFNNRDEIVEAAEGSFFLTQYLCNRICLSADMLNGSVERRSITISLKDVVANSWEMLARQYRSRCERFCRGSKFNRAGRAPYLRVLNLLAESGDWTLDLRYEIDRSEELRGSLSQLVDRGYLQQIIASDSELAEVFHFDSDTDCLTVEDPKFLFFIRNIPWKTFARDIGFTGVKIGTKYDFALSFAGNERDLAALLFEQLKQREFSVFYDKNEQHRIAGKDVENYLKPIYHSEAKYVVVIFGPEYPKRVWTRMESAFYKERIHRAEVIPIWTSATQPNLFDMTQVRGGFHIELAGNISAQISDIANVLEMKMEEEALAENV